MPALGLGVSVNCHAPAPRTVRGLVDGGVPGCSLRDATGIAECALTLGVTARGLDECARDLLAVARPGVTACNHTGPATSYVAVTGLVTSPLLLTVRGLGRGDGGLDGVTGIARKLMLLPAIAVTGLMVAPAPAVAGGATALPTSSFPDLVRLVLSPSWSVEQRGAVLESLLSSAAVTGAGGVPAPAAPMPTAATIACSPSVPASGGTTSACAASATTSHGRCERPQESSHPERCNGRSTGRERSRLGGKRGKCRSPFPARAVRSASASASSSSASSVSEGG